MALVQRSLDEILSSDGAEFDASRPCYWRAEHHSTESGTGFKFIAKKQCQPLGDAASVTFQHRGECEDRLFRFPFPAI